LDCGFNNIVNDGAVALGEALKVNASLTELWLDENSIGDEGAAALGEALKSNAVLTQLHLGLWEESLLVMASREFHTRSASDGKQTVLFASSD
jgi:hypothetical protein